MTTAVHLGDLISSAAALTAGRHRAVLGITGAPGAGKSTVGSRIVDALGPENAVLVPMDGFHLANSVLLAMGLRQVKGAIQTFDDAGYATLLQRICGQRPGEVIYAPSFNRDLEEPIAGSIPVRAEVPLVVTEGNYLLAESGAWPSARACLMESWFLDPDRACRHNWLIARHMDYGKSAEDARSWALGSDEDNARLIKSMAHRADRVLRVKGL
ncbi:nucleoside/nucleotide kinase family protein [Arthrobacter dokdonensis]|uniref:nucleoside/nucleotide kinase family protein n=1 Tax=Arthrobacter dokdonellae TaxID=2211210 RepID=UPI000DE5A567|nr:nucleoside/nucleotide kinase family protein [Arthrobacter dokdonellae]